MPLGLRNLLFSRASRRVLAALLVLAYLATMIGVRFPLGVAARDGKPYPCQGHQCGCRSADECWAHCCCFSPQQRLAWAQANHIEPPVELTAVLLADDHDHDSPADDSAHSCCHKSASSAEHIEPTRRSAAQPQSSPVRGYGFQPAKCYGVSTLWVVSGAVAPPAPPVQWSFDWTISGVLPSLDCSLAAVAARPAACPDPGRSPR